MTKKFKAGDVVMLKSGGPEMTVDGYRIIHDMFNGNKYEDENLVEVRWFLNDNTLKMASLKPETLELVN